MLDVFKAGLSENLERFGGSWTSLFAQIKNILRKIVAKGFAAEGLALFMKHEQIAVYEFKLHSCGSEFKLHSRNSYIFHFKSVWDFSNILSV